MAVFDPVDVDWNISFEFHGITYVYPNPADQSEGDIAYFSFDLFIPGNDLATARLYVYNVAQDLVNDKGRYSDIQMGRTHDLVSWNLKNNAGYWVAPGIYSLKMVAKNSAGDSVDRTENLVVEA